MDVWLLGNKLGATPDREMVRKKFADYNTSDIAVKAKARLDELAQDATATAFYAEMKRFLPSARVAADVTNELAAHNAFRQRSSHSKDCCLNPLGN